MGVPRELTPVPDGSRVVAIISGGMDSATLLHYLEAIGTVRALGFDYGQRHKKELDYANDLCLDLKVEFTRVDLSSITGLLKGSSLTSSEIQVPDGHYAEEMMKQTVVPNRNMIMLSIAMGYAISLKYDGVAYGAHAGDHTIYPDCRPEFAACMDMAGYLADWHKIRVFRPFVGMSKAQICSFGDEVLGIDWEGTWSCYKGGEIHCGACGTCVERREAFEVVGVLDPTPYLDHTPIEEIRAQAAQRGTVLA